MAPTVIGNSRPLKPVDPRKIEEMVQERNALYNAVCIWSEKNSRPLSASMHAPRNQSIEAGSTAPKIDQTRDSSVPSRDGCASSRDPRQVKTEAVVPPDSSIVNSPTPNPCTINNSIGNRIRNLLGNRIIKESSGASMTINMIPEPAIADPFIDNSPPAQEAAPAPRALGIRPPDEFLAQWRERRSRRNPVNTLPPIRRIIFKNVPDWADYSDVLCLVCGGPVECIWSDERNEVMVQFVEEADCIRYFEAFSAGIRVGDHLIEVHQDRCLPLPQEIREWVRAGTTRVVKVHVTPEITVGDFHNLAMDLDIDHIEYHEERDDPGHAYFFFRNLASSRKLMEKLMAPEWQHCPALFFEDPCAGAKGFHSNSLPGPAMAKAVCEAVNLE